MLALLRKLTIPLMTESGGKRKISKAEGVRLCIEELAAGTQAKEIIRICREDYGVATSTVEKWMRSARPEAQERRRAAEAIRVTETEVSIRETTQKLNITRERVLEEYAKIAFFDIRQLFTVDGAIKPIRELDDVTAAGIAGIDSFDEKSPDTGELVGTIKKVKLVNKRDALDSICKVLGYIAPAKKADTDPNGTDIPKKQVIIINGLEIEF